MSPTAIQTQPSIVLKIGTSYVTRTERGEIIETVDVGPDGLPDWTDATICDHRGAGSLEGYEALVAALDNAERNAGDVGVEVERIKD